MTDPLSLTVTAAKVAAPAVGISRSALRRLRLYGTADVKWFDLTNDDWFTTAEVENLETFLSDRGTQALLSLLATTLLTPDSAVRQESVRNLRETFEGLAKRWQIEHHGKWFDRKDSVWDAIRAIFDVVTPAGRVLGPAAQEFTDFVSSPIGKLKTPTSSGERYVERLATLCSNLDRVTTAIDAAAAVKSAIADSPTPPIITYTSTSAPASFEELYVNRTLRYDNSDEAVQHLGGGGQNGPYRAVLHGAPGAGKSTFVRHLRHELARADEGQPALVVNIRNYFQVGETRTIVEYLHASLRTELNLEVTQPSIQDGLVLGQYDIIFDGLDEITDIHLRIQTAARITSFAREYPLTSILVTSRAIGYERAPLPATTFETFVLDQYSTDQAREYITRWFEFIDRSDLIPEFERESVSVSDLKSNPLVLSLLCVLYRERGSIPRRRRDIYAACADLLFHTWDSHRHIAQPEELHANGDRIMQEIARWVYRSQSAQSGLSERVIQKTIGIYLQDHVGVDEGEARRRASEFLEFCATRAWLLGATGTQYGERVFGFTHRTFFEYFAAEAFSRSTSDPKEIAQILLDANKRDATSVLPELLLQAFDEKVDRGAGQAFEQVCLITDDELLVLRLMEGIPLSNRVRTAGFDRVMALWSQKKRISESSFFALLTINPDARKHFINDYLLGREDLPVQLFLGAWAALDLAQGVTRYVPMWGDIVADRGLHVEPHSGEWFSDGIEGWRWLRGHSDDLPSGPASPYLLSTASGKRVGGMWLALETLVTAPERRRSVDIDDYLESGLAAVKRPGYGLTYPVANSMLDALVLRRDLLPSLTGLALQSSNVPLWAYCYLMALIHETTRGSLEIRDLFEEDLLPVARVLWQQRELSSTDDEPLTDKDVVAGLQGFPEVPRWLREWARGKRSFVRDPFDHH